MSGIPSKSEIHSLLRRIGAQAGLQARFLNTLSLMEHIGSRKIMASQSRGGALSGGTLKHLAEETRHAFFFKRAAEALAGRALDYDDADLLAGPQARFYMGRLDAFMARFVTGPAAYLAMSLVIELRAVWFYRLFQQVLQESGQTLKLTSLLAEEESHLADMRARLAELDGGADAWLAQCIAHEESLFATLVAALHHAVPQDRKIPAEAET